MKIYPKLILIALLFVVFALATADIDAQAKGIKKFTTQVATPTPSLSPTQEAVQPFNSFEIFWPISAGRVAGEPLYFLKTLKENLREALIFSEFKKVDYNITLSEKRTVEAEKLFVIKKDYENGKKTLDEAHLKRVKARDLMMKVEEKGKNITDLKNRMTSSLEKQRALSEYIASQVSDDQKVVITETVSKLNSLLATLQ